MLTTDVGKAAEGEKGEFKVYSGLSKHLRGFADT